VQILRRALETPTRQIAENSAVDGGVVIEKMLEGDGVSASTPARKSMSTSYEAGIVDPTKVVRIALENAVSVASVLLLTEATMTESSGTAVRAHRGAGTGDVDARAVARPQRTA
jgi:chaperonin GroEL